MDDHRAHGQEEGKPLEQHLAERLEAEGIITRDELERLQRTGLAQGIEASLPVLLVRLGRVGEEVMARLLAELAGCECLGEHDYPETALFPDQLNDAFLRRCLVVPLGREGDVLRLAMVDPGNTYARRAVALATGCRVEPVVGRLSEIESAIDRLYGQARQEAQRDAAQPQASLADQEAERLRDLASEAPVIRIVNRLFEEAVRAGASDIHVEPFRDRLVVRYRIDGRLQQVDSPPFELAGGIVSRIKLIAQLDIAERRRPQDGRVRMRLQGRDIDVRISTVPTLHGESVVMRLLDPGGIALDFAALGFDPHTADRFRRLLDRPHGLILVTGPTGSGKTTTLYAALDRLNDEHRKILTVEDPVEYQLQGVNQIQVNPGAGVHFASALRSILRQDPDVIMVGELRDEETARTSVQAALTGHLVLATLHTNDAAGAVARLLDMGIEPYLLASTLTAVLAQRLVRRLCPHCRTEQPLAEGERRALGRLGGTVESLYQARGCPHCRESGYRGRTALYELLVVDEAIRELIAVRADAQRIARAARAQGMRTLAETAGEKLASGITSLEEVMRVTLAGE
ncbi:MAG: type II secretion system protein GspE [Gammaproteobacteria bacterium]|nr:MAG: type II secretion system protein GspE [Gammaproteobacteria bacterium]